MGASPTAKEAIPKGKGLSKKSRFYSYYHFPARHVLVAPQGVFAIATRWQDGNYSNSGEQWKTRGGFLSGMGHFFRRDNVGNPTSEAQKAAAHIKALLEKDMPDIDVQPLIVFVDPRARLEIDNPAVPVLYADETREPNLRDYMRELSQQHITDQSVDQGKKKGDKSKSEPKQLSGIIDPEQVADALEEATII
ncbi:MAG: nuclease-related domain-containing protein [Anaerolineae bacterium]